MTAFFVGAYTDEMAKIGAASLLSGTHLMAISGPGTGKTSVFESIAKDVVLNAWCMVRCDPSTPPAQIKGAIDVQRYLKDGTFAENIEGTPFDPKMKLVILDELPRASEVVQHLNIQLLDRARGGEVFKYAQVWGTANFVKVASQLEALYDRVAFWYHVPDEEIDNLEFVRAQVAGRQNGGLKVRYVLPTWEQIEQVRQMKYTDNAVRCVALFMDLIIGELAAKGVKVNRRRREQWQRILLACSAYEHASGDFNQLGELALEVFKYAWAAPKPEDQAVFQEVVAACADPVQHVLDEVLTTAVTKMNEIAKIEDKNQRMLKVGDLGMLISESEHKMQEAGVDPETFAATKIKLTQWFAQAIQGEQIADEG